ncbi:MAG: HAD hydrolase family protein, partial [Gammaproteobacteria bacterium]|nr:HAD hydrolase family protein [Gammaproteobacteria bacterium]
GNADPVVKQAADWVTESNENNGVAALVERLLAVRDDG